MLGAGGKRLACGHKYRNAMIILFILVVPLWNWYVWQQGSTVVSESDYETTNLEVVVGNDWEEFEGSCKPIQDRILPANFSVLSSGRLPKNRLYYPSVANGFLGMVVYSDTIFVAGVYNGFHNNSHRARLPAYCSLNLSTSIDAVRQYTLDLESGIYTEVMTVAGVLRAKYRVLSHRSNVQLLMCYITLERLTSNLQQDISISVSNNQGPPSNDLFILSNETFSSPFSHLHDVPRITHYKTKESETNSSKTTDFYVASNVIPNKLVLKTGQRSEEWMFVAAVDMTSKENAKDVYNKAVQETVNLCSSHISAWRDIWQEGRIDVRGNETVSQAVYATLYYLQSSAAFHPHPTSWNYYGWCPTSLPGQGTAFQAWGGHIFWDQDIWMFPPMMLLHPGAGKLALSDRVRVLPQALRKAALSGFKGAMYPWESAFTGTEVSTWQPSAKREIHVGGDVIKALQLYLYLTRETEWNSSALLLDDILKTVYEVSRFWESRSTYVKERNHYEITNVMGPDEWHDSVNNSAYVNYIAKDNLYFAVNLLKERNWVVPNSWLNISKYMYIPNDLQRSYHPEFDGYEMGNTTVKQADVILLGFPLMMPMSDLYRRHDLQIYEAVTTPHGPAMSWAMFSIGWLELEEFENAKQNFLRNFRNIQEPFKIWSEKTDGGGGINFATGMGGFLQSLLFGWVGVRVHSDHLLLKPTLEGFPVERREGEISVMGLHWHQLSLDITVKNSKTIVAFSKLPGGKTETVTVDLIRLKDKIVKRTILRAGKRISCVPGYALHFSEVNSGYKPHQ